MSENRILTDLPKWEEGRYKGETNWTKTINMDLELLYQDKIYKVRVIKYNEGRLILDYKGYVKPEGISYRKFLKGSFGGVLNLRNKNFKVEIDQTFKDNKRDLIITDREYRNGNGEINKKTRYKWYKYTCNKCGWTEGWMEESHLIKGGGCSCCSGKTVVPEINSIYAKAPWMMRWMSEEDAKKYLPNSSKKIEVVCPDCRKGKVKQIGVLYRDKSLGCACGDKTSYPEKFIYNLLEQLKIKFQTQLTTFTFNWCESYKYDFYLPEFNMIIETHGMQHYEQTGRKGARTLEEEQENDRLKRELALSNGVKHYIELDCRYSDLDYIKDKIIKSELNNLFNLEDINWLKCEEFALSNLVKKVCEYWNNKEGWETTYTIAALFKMDRTTVSGYLKKGTKLGWCIYDTKEEYIKGLNKAWLSSKKEVEIFKDGESLGIFESCVELSRQSEELFGVKLDARRISDVCNKKLWKHKDFAFKYIDEEDQQIAS